MILSVLVIVGCNDNSEIDYASQKEKNIQLKIELSECILSINDLKMLDIQKDEIKNKESLNELDYEDLKIENSQLATSIQECKSKLKEREVRENEKVEARAKAKKKSTENGTTISCGDVTRTVHSHYKKALGYLEKGMKKRADIVYQVLVKDKRTFMLVCKDTRYLAIIKKLEPVDNALLENSIYVNANKLQDSAKENIKILSERKGILERDMENLTIERERIHEKYERKRKAIDLEVEQKIEKFKRKAYGY